MTSIEQLDELVWLRVAPEDGPWWTVAIHTASGALLSVRALPDEAQALAAMIRAAWAAGWRPVRVSSC